MFYSKNIEILLQAGIGGDLRVYLEKMATAEHVQYYVKDNPFGQPAITDSHPYWKFYLRIIENLDKPLVSAWYQILSGIL